MGVAVRSPVGGNPVTNTVGSEVRWEAAGKKLEQLQLQLVLIPPFVLVLVLLLLPLLLVLLLVLLKLLALVALLLFPKLILILVAFPPKLVLLLELLFSPARLLSLILKVLSPSSPSSSLSCFNAL